MDAPVNSQAYELLLKPQEFKIMKSDPNFINHLAENPQFLKDLLDISFRPKHFQEIHHVYLSPSLPAMSIQSLTSLYEELITLITYDKIIQKDRSLQGLERDQELIQCQVEATEDFMYLTHMHKAFEDGEQEDASMSNLSRLLGPVYYQSSDQIMKFYGSHSQSLQNLIQNLWRRDVMDIFCKLMEAQSGKQFFRECKIKFIEHYFKTLLAGFQIGEHRCEWLEGLLQFHRFVMEKMEEKYDGRKYMSLLAGLNQGDLAILQTVLKIWQQLPDKIALVCLKWCQQCLKMDSFIWGASELRVPITNLSRKYSMSNSFYDEEQGDSKKSYHLCQSLLHSLASLLKVSQSRFFLPSQKNALHLIAFFKSFYFWIKVVSSAKSKEIYDLEPLLQTMVNRDLLLASFSAAERHPTCIALHNYIKELIIQCITLKLIPIKYFTQHDNPFLEALKKSLPRKTINGYRPMGPQSYHIYQEILKKEPDLLSSQLTMALNDEKSRREKSIGGQDPRKLQDNLRGSYAFSEESEEIIQIDIPSLRNASSNELGHGSPCPLKLSHPLSIEKTVEKSIEMENSDN